MSNTADFASLYSGMKSSPRKGFHLGTSAAPMNFSKSRSCIVRHRSTQFASLSGCSASKPRKNEIPRCRSMHFRRYKRKERHANSRRASLVCKSGSTLARASACNCKSMGSWQRMAAYCARSQRAVPTSRSNCAGACVASWERIVPSAKSGHSAGRESFESRSAAASSHNTLYLVAKMVSLWQLWRRTSESSSSIRARAAAISLDSSSAMAINFLNNARFKDSLRGTSLPLVPSEAIPRSWISDHSLTLADETPRVRWRATGSPAAMLQMSRKHSGSRSAMASASRTHTSRVQLSRKAPMYVSAPSWSAMPLAIRRIAPSVFVCRMLPAGSSEASWTTTPNGRCSGTATYSKNNARVSTRGSASDLIVRSRSWWSTPWCAP
mmetsp:Transcript_2160/g.6447  ORF Transcript_2160/g.6447 Transcript_2160/m.6447 type:complete len:381 (-) Transcript_2160:602-1744(-)